MILWALMEHAPAAHDQVDIEERRKENTSTQLQSNDSRTTELLQPRPTTSKINSARSRTLGNEAAVDAIISLISLAQPAQIVAFDSNHTAYSIVSNRLMAREMRSACPNASRSRLIIY